MKVNVGTIGHIDHGKTTLTAALVRVLGEKMAKQVVVVDESNAAEFVRKNLDFSEIGASAIGSGRPRNAKRKAAWRAKLKAAQLKAMQKRS